MDNIKRLFEQLTNEMNALLAQGENITTQQQELASNDQNLKDKLKAVQTEKDLLARQREEFNTEKDFIVKSSAEIDLKTKRLQSEQVKSDGLLKELSTKREEISKQEEALNLKIKMAEGIEERMANLEYRESLLEKEKAIDRERKEMLDLREQALTAKGARLQKVADQLGQ